MPRKLFDVYVFCSHLRVAELLPAISGAALVAGLLSAPRPDIGALTEGTSFSLERTMVEPFNTTLTPSNETPTTRWPCVVGAYVTTTDSGLKTPWMT